MSLLGEGRQVVFVSGRIGNYSTCIITHDNPSEGNGHTTRVRICTAYYPWTWEGNVSK